MKDNLLISNILVNHCFLMKSDFIYMGGIFKRCMKKLYTVQDSGADLETKDKVSIASYMEKC